MRLKRTQLTSPLGPITLLSSPSGLVSLCWNDRWEQRQRHLQRHLGTWAEEPEESSPAKRALSAYFDGTPAALHDVPLDLLGTVFQKRVWDALIRIPAGRSWSYKRLAAEIGQPSAYRAVANANGKNPIPLFVPCHRVIAADGSLGGFSAGLHRKDWLLNHETRIHHSE